MQTCQFCINTSLGDTPRVTTNSENPIDQYLGFASIPDARWRIIAIAFDHIGWFTSAVAVSITGWRRWIKVSAYAYFRYWPWVFAKNPAMAWMNSDDISNSSSG
jgi:hypothetical protein